MSEKTYNLHECVKFSLIGPENFVSSFRYTNYQSDSVDYDDLDFVVKVGKFDPDLQGCQILDDKFYVKSNYLFCRDRYKLIKWDLELKNIDDKGPIVVRLNINPFFMRKLYLSYILIEGLIIDAMIHCTLTQKGHALLHASCGSKDKNGILFVARSGGGKTSVILQLIKENYNFVSDNFSILTSNNKVLGFIEPLNIFNYNINDYIYSSMTKSQKVGMKLRYLIYLLSNKYVKIFSRINPCVIFNDIVSNDEIDLKAVFLLIPNNDLKFPKMKKISKEETIEHIYQNQLLEFPYFEKYSMYYSYAFPKDELSNQWDTYKKNIEYGLGTNLPYYKIEVPTVYSKESFDIIMEMVKDGQRNNIL